MSSPMNGRLLRQALFSSKENDAYSANPAPGRFLELPHNSRPTTPALYMRPLADVHEYSADKSDVSEACSTATRHAGLPMVLPHVSPQAGECRVGDDIAMDRPGSTAIFSLDAARLHPQDADAKSHVVRSVPDFARNHGQHRKMRAFSQMKPGRSLHQRLASDESQEPPPYPGVVAPAVAAHSWSEQVPRKSEDLIPRAQSRSVSVLSSVRGGQDEDISSIMMRGATDLRNAKYEIEEQRREIAMLQSQVDAARKEKDELSQRLKTVKEAAKQSFQTSSKSLEALRSSVAELKTQSESSFTIISEARSSLVDVQEIRATVAASLQGFEPYLEGGEEWAKTREAKNAITELTLECSKSQQVADLLRDRLQSVGAELIEAKNRVAELETAQAEDRAALSRANVAIASTNKRIRSEWSTIAKEVSSLAVCMKKQQGELYDALSVAAESEARLGSANERIQELQLLFESRSGELQTLTGIRHEVSRLQEIVAEKEANIAELMDAQKEVPLLRSALHDRDVQIAELISLNTSKDTAIGERDTRVQQLEEEVGRLNTEVRSLKEKIGTSQAREDAALADVRRLRNEEAALTERLNDLEATLARVREELESRAEKLLEANLRYQSLEERFEDQSVTLRITREAAGDAQAAEASHAVCSAGKSVPCDALSSLQKLSIESNAKHEQEIAVLHEQKLGLQATIDAMAAAVQRQEQTLEALRAEHTDRIKELSAIHAARLQQEEKHIQQLTDDLADARTRISTSEANGKRLEDEIRDLRNQLREAQLPSPEAEAELRALRNRVATLEAADMRSTLRARTIESRYRNGDLNDEEKAFINTLVRTSQAIHEQELVANRNELRRRDNALKEMRAKVHLLESTVAKHINAPKTKPAVTPTVGAHSMIDPTAWMSSGQSSSPVQAPDRDGQTDVDVTVVGKASTGQHANHPAPPSSQHTIMQAQAPRAEVPQSSKTPALKATPLAETTALDRTQKPRFSRLATDCSDEILDFDDAAPRKSSPLSALGKRDKPSSPPKNDDSQVASRPSKRPRTAARKSEGLVHNASPKNVGTKKAMQPSTSKTKARKRHHVRTLKIARALTASSKNESAQIHTMVLTALRAAISKKLATVRSRADRLHSVDSSGGENAGGVLRSTGLRLWLHVVVCTGHQAACVLGLREICIARASGKCILQLILRPLKVYEGIL
ncbi:hypothetical protein OH77DRAFT_1438040 [Trametes cingulata]|nr:hypothetical protein OH77DRAFT_1438040 [Trametes cingulata]